MANKRFERIYADVDVFCRDNNSKGISQLIGRDDYDKIVDLLNELHESNIEKQMRLNLLNEQKNEAIRNAVEKGHQILRLEKRETEQLEPIRKVCEKYNIKLEDIAETLEEYICLDNGEEL